MIKHAARSLLAYVITTVVIGYLVTRRRRVAHRDVKPGNVIRRPRTGPLR